MPWTGAVEMVVRVAWRVEVWEMWGESSEMRVRIVWRGSSGSQVSIWGLSVTRISPQDALQLTHGAEGTKPFIPDIILWLLRLDILFCRENDGWPAGILPLAFSDIPRSCKGTASSTEEAIEGFRESWTDGDDCDGADCSRCSSSSESSSSPIVKVPPSSGTSLSEVVLAVCGLLRVSDELLRGIRGEFDVVSVPSAESFVC